MFVPSEIFSGVVSEPDARHAAATAAVVASAVGAASAVRTPKDGITNAMILATAAMITAIAALRREVRRKDAVTSTAAVAVSVALDMSAVLVVSVASVESVMSAAAWLRMTLEAPRS